MTVRLPPIALDDLIEAMARTDGAYAVACGLLGLTKATHAVAEATREAAAASREVAEAIQRLGLADAATPMGAVEMLALEVKQIGSALTDLNAAVVDAGDAADCSQAVEHLATAVIKLAGGCTDDGR